MVQQVDKVLDDSVIRPDFIYNRIDLFTKDVILLHVQGDHEYDLEVQLCSRHAELGIWMMPVSGRELDEIFQFLFRRYRNLDYIVFNNTISDRVFQPKRHYDVVLPDSCDMLRQRLSAKSRNTMSRKLKKAEAQYGRITMREYAGEAITDDILSEYFLMKAKTHHRDYQMTTQEYLSRYHVSNVYVLKFGEQSAAMVLTCEQCPIAYLENLTYDQTFSLYSPGMMAYEMVLERLITKGKTHFYLGGGDYDYKKKYGSMETQVTSGRIYRSKIVAARYKFHSFVNKYIFHQKRP